ncbi:MAG: hypothetical protein PHV20_08620 [Bacteroidales bacterium]|nr:hypothetical protein [Bacteroidales bacterium]
MNFRISLLAFLLSLPILSIFSQTDFRNGSIVTLENDTITGFIDYLGPQDNSQKCMFRKSLTDSVVEYTPSTIKSYFFSNNKYFVSKGLIIDGQKQNVFLEYLVKGRINLFYLDDNTIIIEKENELLELNNNDLIIKKKSGLSYINPSPKFRGVLRYALMEAPSLNEEINSMDFYYVSFVKLVKEYHKIVCNDEGCIVFNRKKKQMNDSKWTVNFGGTMDYMYSFMSSKMNEINTTTPLNQVNTNTSAGTISPGIFVNFSQNSNSSFQIECRFEKLTYSYVSLTSIKLPVVYKYEFNRYAKTSPYFAVGTGISKVIKTTKNSLLNEYYNDEVGVWNSKIEESEYVSLNYFETLRLGIKHELKNKNALNVELRVDRSPTTIKYYFKNGSSVLTDYLAYNIALSVRYIIN